MKRKRFEMRTVIILMSVMITTFLAGCGNNTSSDKPTEVTETETTEVETTESIIDSELEELEDITMKASEEDITEIESETEIPIDVYEILSQIHDYPIYFLVDTLPDGQENFLGTTYAVTDNGDNYTVTGTVKVLDVILKDTGIENMDAGDKVTSFLGTEYIVTYNDHASNGNWIGIDLEDTEGNAFHIDIGLSGPDLTSPCVSISESDTDLRVVKTYEHVSFQVPVWSALIAPSPLLLNIGGEEVVDYQGMFMDDDGVIHSNHLPEGDFRIYDENGNVIAD